MIWVHLSHYREGSLQINTTFFWMISVVLYLTALIHAELHEHLALSLYLLLSLFRGALLKKENAGQFSGTWKRSLWGPSRVCVVLHEVLAFILSCFTLISTEKIGLFFFLLLAASFVLTCLRLSRVQWCYATLMIKPNKIQIQGFLRSMKALALYMLLGKYGSKQ